MTDQISICGVSIYWFHITKEKYDEIVCLVLVFNQICMNQILV